LSPECISYSKAGRLIVFAVALTLIHSTDAWALPESGIEIAGTEFQLVTIPPGTFIMGSDSADGDERPAHKVTIDYSFDIGKTEVTVAQFRAFVKAADYEKKGWTPDRRCSDHMGSAENRPCENPRFEQTESHPIARVTYYDAKAFCKWLSQQTGENFRLPTEAEWEYACRTGTAEGYSGDVEQMAWFDATSERIIHPVARKKPNPWGLYDMHGNVWEWVLDMWHDGADGAPADGSAWLDSPDRPNRGVVRGGSFYNPSWLLRSYIRMRTPLGYRIHFNNGFRIAMSFD